MLARLVGCDVLGEMIVTGAGADAGVAGLVCMSGVKCSEGAAVLHRRLRTLAFCVQNMRTASKHWLKVHLL